MEGRKTTAQLKAYLDNAGDILDVDGNGALSSSNDGLVIFKYLLNPNSNNLHTTIANNAVEGKKTTAQLKTYLDELELESEIINVSVGSSTIQAFDSYATGCVDAACEHNFAVAIGIEQGGKLSAADGSILYDNFVEHFASGPLIKDSIPQNTSTNKIWLPPNSSSCNAVFFNDKMKIYNPTANDISVMRLINSSGTITSEVVNQARNNCSMVGPADQDLRYTNPISNILVDPVTVTANAFTMFNINGQKLDLSALETAKILFVDKADYDAKIAAGEPLTFDSCMQMEFSIQGDGSRSTNASDKDSWISCIQSSYEYLNTQPGTPIANAGNNQSVAFSTTVNLSGSATDSDGTIVSYAWTQIYGTKLTLTAADTANASFDSSGVDFAGEVLTFALTVTDNDGVTARDNVIITVAANPDRLIANAGIDQSDIEIDATVTLTASTTGGTGSISNYAWQQISGATVSITGANSAVASFVAPRVTATGTTIDIVLQLTVTDSNNATATDTITITVDAFVLTAAEELAAIFALGTSPTALVDYPVLDAEADGISGQTERAQHIVDSLTNLDGVTVTYISNSTPKLFNVAKSGETAINVLQDSSSGSAVSLDTLSVFKDIYFQTIQAKWDILHPVLTPAEIKAANELKITNLVGSYSVTVITISNAGGLYANYEQTYVTNVNGFPTLYFRFGNYADFGVIPQSIFDTKFDEFVAKLIADELTPAEVRAIRIAEIESVGNNGVTVVHDGFDSNSFTITLGNDSVNVSTLSVFSTNHALEFLSTSELNTFKTAVIEARDNLLAAAELAALRTERINQLEALDQNSVTVTYYDDAGSDQFGVNNGTTVTYLDAVDYGANKIENLTAGEYTTYKDAIILKRNQLDPISDYNLNTALSTFYDATTAPDAVGGGAGYGQQLPATIESVAATAFGSGDNDTIEAFLKKLSNGATHKGIDSYLEWFPNTSYLVTNNGGEGNGFYDIPLTDNAYLAGNAGDWEFIDLSESNVRHLAYHIMWNFYTLANQSEATLKGFRLARFDSYVKAARGNDWGYNESTHSNGSLQYKPTYNSLGELASGADPAITSNFQTGAVSPGELSASNWADMLAHWKVQVTNAD